MYHEMLLFLCENRPECNRQKFYFHSVKPACHDYGTSGPENNSCCPVTGDIKNNFCKHVTCFYVRHKEHIRITGNGRINFLYSCSLSADSIIKGERTINDTSCDLASSIHLGKRCCIYCAGHIRVDRFDCSKYCYFRIFLSKFMKTFDRIFNYLYLGPKIRIHVHSAVRNSHDLISKDRSLKKKKMR